MKMIPIVLYSRVSTKDQDFEQQVEALKTWAIANQFSVADDASFGEKVSGYDPDAERKEYDKMKAYVLDNNIKNIAIWEMSRLSRSMIKTRTELDYFTSIGVNVHFKKEGMQSISNNSGNKLLLTIIAAMAEMERETIIEKFARGKLSSILKGTVVSYSTMPYGYKRSDSEDGKIVTEKINKKCAATFEVNEEEAKVVRLMFEMAIQGTSLKEIARHLNITGKPTRRTISGKKHNDESIKWVGSVIGRCLKRTLYKGVREFKDNKISVPAIVSVELWNAVKERFKHNEGYLNRPTAYKYLFKGKMRCGLCGKTICAKTSKQDSYYRCNGHDNIYENCKLGRLNTKIIDNNLYQILLQHKDVGLHVENAAKKDFGIEEKRQQIENLKKEIEQIENKRKRLIKSYINGDISESEQETEKVKFRNATVSLTNNIKIIESRIKNSSTISISELMSNYWYTEDYDIKRDFVTKYVDRILVYTVDKTNIQFKAPLHKNEKIIYIELWAFGAEWPLKIVLTPWSKNVYLANKMNRSSSGVYYMSDNLSHFKDIRYLVEG